MTTIVIDYGRGNLFSLGQALSHLGATWEISDSPSALLSADRIIFPGVGAFGDAMEGLSQNGLVEPLKQAASAGIPILGICVGCQLLMRSGEEFGHHEGLGLIEGTVLRLPDPREGDPAAIRIPNVGWRQLRVHSTATAFKGIAPDQMMYFVHSFAPVPKDAGHVAATIQINGHAMPIAVQAANLVGVQFHPEKSGPAGLAFIGRFLES